MKTCNFGEILHWTYYPGLNLMPSPMTILLPLGIAWGMCVYIEQHIEHKEKREDLGFSPRGVSFWNGSYTEMTAA